MMDTLRRTPLYPAYKDRIGAKLVDFGGWEMPIQFAAGILAEHSAVRNRTGLFDVSHMGEVQIRGKDAGTFIDYLVTNTVKDATPGQCIYSPMCRPSGGCVDDLLVYVLSSEDYLLVVNAANTDKDVAWIQSVASGWEGDLRIENVSNQWAQLALQGPGALKLLQNLVTDMDLETLPYYRHRCDVRIAGIPTLLSRTGYTGEDGFELYCEPHHAVDLWNSLEKLGACPCGLGARDMLRLEARFPLYGHELTDEIGPLESGLGMFVKLEKESFVGRDSLEKQKTAGIPRRIYGLEMLEAGVAREGYSVECAGEKLGFITSGGKSPIRDSFIALALLKRGSVAVNDEVDVDIRGKRKRARVVKMPFYRKKAL